MTELMKPVLAAAFAFLAGCSLTPDYERPDVRPSAAKMYPAAAGETESGIAVADIGWREFFHDPQLQELIELALLNNNTLTSATLDILAARAQYNIQSSERLPNLSIDGSLTRTRVPASVSATGFEMTTEQYQVGLGIAAFELDFFGRVESLSESALAQYLATEEAARSVKITLIAEVARAYLAERALAEQLELARQTLEGREAAYELAVQRHEAGAASTFDLRQHEVLLESAHVAVPALKREHAQARNALVLLVGTPLDAFPETATLGAQAFADRIPADLSSRLLVQRPDIRAAEQRLISANANIGAARAAFFPRISLTGSVGSVSGELSGLFGAGTDTWSFIPRISLPIFSGGRNSANLELAKVRKHAAVVQYEQAVQTAFREVADALVARATLNDQLSAQRRLRDAQAERLALARQRYEAGAASYLEVLDAEREFFAAEQALVQVRQQQLASAVGLYRALGGGLRENSVSSQGEGEAASG
ncbi:MAG TPA: efflux transporter outer membrane subunit [Gammaproteobacteria bacterium]